MMRHAMTAQDDKRSLADRARKLAGQLVDAAKDPDGDAHAEAAEAERDRRDKLILEAFHAARKPAQPLVGTPLATLDALRDHLKSGGSAVAPQASGLRIAGDPPIDVDWAVEHRQVRFTITPDVRVPADKKAAVAAVVATGNAQTGIPVWRAEPELIAEVTAPCAADGSVSSAEVDRAVKILRTTVARDAADLRKAVGG
jgi:hypothetical protein